MSFTYLWINIAIIAGPLWATRDPQLAYRRQLPAVAAAIAVVSSLYITWDSIAAGRGEWSFNPRYVTGIKVFNLPIEEILFFITVPYACLLLYEVVRIKTKQARFELSRAWTLKRTWDRKAIPQPLSTITVRLGPALIVTEQDLDRCVDEMTLRLG